MKHTCGKCGDVTPTDKGRCPTCGRLMKGFSGNKSGRPKSNPSSSYDPSVHGKDAKAAMEHALETAVDRREALRIAKDLAPYQTPKLASVESKEQKDTTLTIRWEGEDTKEITMKTVSDEEEVDKKLSKAIEDTKLDKYKKRILIEEVVDNDE